VAISVFGTQLFINTFNVPPNLGHILLHTTNKNIMDKNIECAAQQRLINAKRLAVHPIRVKAQN
jgi:hypothetical protein